MSRADDSVASAPQAALEPSTIDVSILSGNNSSERRAATVASIEAACTTDGLFLAVGHGIEQQLEAAFEASRGFFALPPEIKDRVPRTNRYGYVPDRVQARKPEDAVGKDASSLASEYLDMGLADEFDLATVEILGCDGFTAAVRNYQDAVLGVAHQVLEALTVTLGVPEFFASRMSAPQCRLRFLHYRPCEISSDGEVPVFSKPHTDYGAITVLAVDGRPGLEVLHNGVWKPVAAPAGSLIVQLGDMLARWTNDRYRSTPHRVVGVSGTDRFSIPFFVNPDPQTVISVISSCVTADQPARYEPVTAGEFLAARIDSPAEPYV